MENSDRKRFLDTYLSSPIIRNERDAAFPFLVSLRQGVKRKEKGTYHRGLRTLAKKDQDYLFTLLEPDEYLDVDQNLVLDDKASELENAKEISSKISEFTDKGLGDWGMRLPESCRERSSRLNTPHLSPLYTKMRFFEKYLNTVAKSRAAGGRGMVEVREGSVSLYGNEYLVLLSFHHRRTVHLMSYTQCCMFKDMYYGRFNALLAADCLYPGGECSSVIEEFFSWALQCLHSYGNLGYEVVKYIEALAKTNLTRKMGGVFSTDGPHQKMVDIAMAKEAQMPGGSQGYIEILEEILSRGRRIEVDVELFGLQKLSGHPLVDPLTGGEKVRETSRKRIVYSPAKLKRLRNNFCRMYLEGYIRRTSAWPPLEARPGANQTRLYELMLLNELNIKPTSYPIEDWEFFRFRKHHDFHYYPNFMDLMDDKSISYYRDQFMATWDTSITLRSHKRLLIEMLSRPEISIREIVDRVRQGDIPFSWLIVSLYPKEREFKMDPRMFGMMVFEMRAFFTCTEANIADQIFPNIPAQTMTLSKIEIQEMFQEVTKSHEGGKGVRLYEEFDLSGWNGHFHDEVVDPIGYDLEDMFGLPGAFTVIHHFFKNSIMSVRVRECPPKHGHLAQTPGLFTRSHESNVLWPDHDAGIEGLAQKVWSCPTYSMFDLAMQKFGVKYYLIGQADNQTCTAWISEDILSHYPGGIKELALRIAEEAQAECQAVGHELNLDECIHSSDVITYSKDVYIRGAEFYTSVKALSRVFPHSASDFPSVVNSVSAISGQCLAAAEECKDPLVSYVLSAFHTALYLTTLHLRTPVESLYLPATLPARLTRGVVTTMMCYPGEAGGLPVGHVMGFLYKGGADPLGKALASLKILSSGSKTVRRVIFALKTGIWMDKSPDITRLLDDPYSLPVKSPRTPEMTVLADGISRVKYLTKNVHLRGMLDFVTGGYEEELKHCLASARPFNPVLMADILGLSLVGVSRAALKMFTSTQTIQGLLQGDKDLNPCLRILTTGASQFHTMVLRIIYLPGPEATISSVYSFTEELRRFWSPDGSVTISGVSSVTPVDLQISYDEPSSTIPGFKLEVGDRGGTRLHYRRGPEKVYFGRPTREHRSEHGYRIITTSAPERAVAQLARIATQKDLSPGFISAVSHVVSTRGNMELEETLPLLGAVYGGSLLHRYQSRLGHLSANILGTTVFSSHCSISTDTAPPISGGEDDYAIMVQAVMVALLGIASLSWPFPSNSRSLTLRTDTHSWEPLQDTEIDIPHDSLPAPQAVPQNPLIYAPEITLERSITRHVLPMIRLAGIKGREQVLPYFACLRAVSRQLQRSHSASAIADRGAGSVHIDLDIAEVHRLGGVTVARLAAVSIAQLALEALFTRGEGEWRWTPMPVIMSLSRAVSVSLVKYLRHPLVQAEQEVKDLFPTSGVRYSERRVSMADKVERFLTRRALALFNTPSSQLFETPLVLFYDDPDGEAWRALAHAFKRSCLQAAAVSELTIDQAYILVRRNMTATVMGKRTELKRSARMAQFISNILTWAKENDLPQLTHSLSVISEGKAVLMTQCALAEALRLARRLGDRPPAQTPAIPTLNDILEVEVHNLASMGHSVDFGVVTDDAWKVNPNLPTYVLWECWRLRGRLFGGDSSAGYSYIPLIPVVRGRSFFSVGCGHGGGAAVLVMRGATRCYGLDLESDLDPTDRMNGTTTPQAFQLAAIESSFTRVTCTQGWTGDIYEPLATEQLMLWCTPGQVWVVDIPLIQPSQFSSLLSQIFLIDPHALLAIRVIGPIGKALDSLSLSSLYSTEVEWRPVFRRGAMVEGWVVVGFKGSTRRSHRRYTLLPGMERDTETPEWMVATGGGKTYLLDVATHGLSGLSSQELEIGVSQLESMAGASVGELDHRFTYKQWTDVLEALAVEMVLQDPQPLLKIVRICASDTLPLAIAGRTITKSVDRSLRRLLIKVVSRIIG